MKHIESIQPEYAAEELERIVREEGDATASAALSRLLHDWTGCAIPPLATTPQSEVEELVPLCLSILRRHWTTPLTALGDGNTPVSFADLLRRLILGRVDGNEALGIPPANANIPTAVSALRERKISGVPEAPDGLSLPRLLCDSSIADTITELIDDNVGWVMDRQSANALPNVTKATIGCKSLLAPVSSTLPNAEDLEFPYLEQIDTAMEGHIQANMFYGNIKRIYMPNVKKLYVKNASYQGVFYNITTPCEILTPNCTEVYSVFDNNYPRLFYATSGVTKWVLGTIKSATNILPNGDFVNLLHLEFGQGTSASLNLRWWTATNVISDPAFLSNFRQYIADRLSDNGSGKTLTLSQEVRDAIQQDPEIVSIITSKGWTISPAPSV